MRDRIARGRALASERFRDAFQAGQVGPEGHLAIQAKALLEVAEGMRVRGGGAIEYDIRGRDVTPFVVRGEPLFPRLSVLRTPEGIFEYFMIISEILVSPSWSVTKLIASAEEYDDALRRMKQPQIVRATFLVGASPTVRSHVNWLRSMRGERPEYKGVAPTLSMAERIVILTVVLAFAVFEVWFFFFSTSSIDQRSGRGEAPSGQVARIYQAPWIH